MPINDNRHIEQPLLRYRTRTATTAAANLTRGRNQWALPARRVTALSNCIYYIRVADAAVLVRLQFCLTFLYNTRTPIGRTFGPMGWHVLKNAQHLRAGDRASGGQRFCKQGQTPLPRRPEPLLSTPGPLPWLCNSLCFSPGCATQHGRY